MMSVVDWDPIFPGPPQKSLVEPLHSLAVHFERSAGKDVKQKHKPSCNIKRWINWLTKDSSPVSIVNVSSYYVYMMNGRMMNQKQVWSICCLFFPNSLAISLGDLGRGQVFFLPRVRRWCCQYSLPYTSLSGTCCGAGIFWPRKDHLYWPCSIL